MDRYVMSAGKKLRCGYTTGSCAAAAAKAAAMLILEGRSPDWIDLPVPAGGTVRIPVEQSSMDGEWARCGVRKDSGDDPDITNGMMVCASVSLSPDPGVWIDGGEGVGRVTLPGLDQPVGSAAINSVPRKMIQQAAEAVCDEAGYGGGLKIIISLPDGRKLAEKTFNPRLGIVGGLSVLGTSGIVEPMSEQALVDSIKVEIRMRRALGRETALFTPGNYGRDFLRAQTEIPDRAVIRCSNFIGEALDYAVELGFSKILLVGHLGKLVKLAGNMFNTHSRYGDCRMDILTAHAAMAGVSPDAAREMMASATVDHALDVLEPAGRMEATLSSVLASIEKNIQARAGMKVPVALFTNVRGPLIQSEDFPAGLELLLKEEG